jgi:hypothetical protein
MVVPAKIFGNRRSAGRMREVAEVVASARPRGGVFPRS